MPLRADLKELNPKTGYLILNRKESIMTETTIVEVKKPWQSKTMWMNFLMGIVGVITAFVPAAKEYLSAEMFIMLFSVANMIMRMVTKGRLSLD